MRCPSPLHLKDPKSDSSADRITVPCGKCGACRANRRADWSFRLKQELKDSINGFFLTLTYDDEKLPRSIDDIPTLNKKHWQNFVKRLRKNSATFCGHKLRYYTVGEYGTETGRPHYHPLIFNLDTALLNSLPDIWGNGNIHIGSIEPASIHYVAKFHVNTNKEEIIDEQTGQIYERVSEFALMSRNPGIGAGYIERNKEWHREHENTFVINNGYKQRLPRYYRERIFDPITSLRITLENRPELDKNYNQEIKRLANLKIESPHSYILKSQVEQAKKVKNKAQEGNTF